MPSSAIALRDVDDLLRLLQTLRQTTAALPCPRGSLLSLLRHVHLSLCDLGVDGLSDVCNYLVPAFLDRGSSPDALRVLRKTPRRNQHSWTSLVASPLCADRFDVRGALRVYGEMRKDGVFPSKCTFLALLGACCRSACSVGGLLLHHDVASNSFEEEAFVASSLVHLYARCGLTSEAQCVFDKLRIPDVIAWTVLIIGYAQFGDAAKALCCIEDMIRNGVSPNAFTIVATLKACDTNVGPTVPTSKAGDSNVGPTVPTSKACNHNKDEWIKVVRKLHIVAAKQCLEIHPFVGSALTDIYTKLRLLSEARCVFDNIADRDVVSWNVLIGGYVENHEGNKGLHCFEKMHMDGISPDTTTFNFVLKACCSVKGGLEKGQEIYLEIVKKEFERDLFVGNSLIELYIKFQLLEEAIHIFTHLSARDVVSWNLFMVWYVEHELAEETLKCLRAMVVDCVQANEVTYFCALKACCIIGSPEAGQEVHSEILKRGCEEEHNGKCSDTNLRTSLGTSIVDMYAKCSLMNEAQWVFDALHYRHRVAWNAIMTGYTHQGNSETFFFLLDRMRMESIEPDAITFLCVLTICSFSGLVQWAYIFLEMMTETYNLLPNLKHYGCMIDLLGRSGQLDEAVVMAENMPFQPDLPLWSTMLGACQKLGNVKIGIQAYNFAHTIDETHYASYISISNIYAIAKVSENGGVAENLQYASKSSVRTCVALSIKLA